MRETIDPDAAAYLRIADRLEEAIEACRRALAVRPNFVKVHSNLLFCLNYMPDLSAEAIFAEYRRWNERHAKPLAPAEPRYAVARDPERRLRVGDDLVLFCHASPGSLTDGLGADLDPVVTIDRVCRTDAKVIVCGHTHLPEVREVGWRTIVNDGSAGYVFDGDPTASWALIEIDDEGVRAEIHRTNYDALEVANAVSARGLPGDVYRAATIRTGKLVR